MELLFLTIINGLIILIYMPQCAINFDKVNCYLIVKYEFSCYSRYLHYVNR
ncbi:hypothetical protein VCHA43P277_160046 [Vibrio chagasii]|nr:hypothetical protein VCHA34P126_140129 [Vibrio chagasii]CAH6980632.1 hypothetical protein VCHA43P277_160046 [Vibrio chagasii]CAH7028994.1 hypothetical protein VCHA41O247_160046 [Vibrio chagasii]CAH7238472.1 hypothetical protein VCHA50P420_160001 [Vibrio chagasii]